MNNQNKFLRDRTTIISNAALDFMRFKMIYAAGKILHKSASQISRKKLTGEEIKNLQQELITQDHMIPLEQLCVKLNTNVASGLTNEEAEKLLLEVGPNALTPPKVTPEYIKFLKCMFHGFAGLMWACSLLCYLLYGISMATEGESGGIEWLGIIIMIICLFSGFCAYIQETKNTKVK